MNICEIKNLRKNYKNKNKNATTNVALSKMANIIDLKCFVLVFNL